MDFAAAVLSFVVYSVASGGSLTVNAVAEELAIRDVIFLGEEHDNLAGHHFQAEVIEALYRCRPDIVISMEMFERDAQGVLDDYLKGRIDEATFLKHSRPWNTYKDHYRRVIEFAKAKGLDVIAGNVPRNLARKVSSKGVAEVEGEAHLPRQTTSPLDEYYGHFVDAMKGHIGNDNTDALERMYTAQCLKDDAMAESITDYLRLHRHRRPLVVHLCGKFHSDHGLGTASRVLSRSPLVLLGVVTMVAVEDVEKLVVADHKEKGHFIVAVPAAKKEAPKEPKAAAETKDKPAVVATEPTPKADEPKEEVPPADAAPALGVQPDYGATEPGLTLAGVRDEGPAAKAGLKGGDRIIKFDGETVEDVQHYMDLLNTCKPGQKVSVVIVRDGEEKTLEVKLGWRQRS